MKCGGSSICQMGGGGASGGATSLAGGSTVWPIYPANSIKSNNNIYKLTSKSQYSDFITSLFININIEIVIIIIIIIIIIITKHKHQWHYSGRKVVKVSEAATGASADSLG
jgi:hypothetical protein